VHALRTRRVAESLPSIVDGAAIGVHLAGRSLARTASEAGAALGRSRRW